MSFSSPNCKLYNYNMLRPQPRLIQTFLNSVKTQKSQTQGRATAKSLREQDSLHVR